MLALLILVRLAASWRTMIIVIVNRAPVGPSHWTGAATTAIFFGRTPVIPIPGTLSINIIDRTYALPPGTPTVFRSIGLPTIP